MHHNCCKSLKALGIMLCYPSTEWIEGIDELYLIIANEGLVDAGCLKSLQNFITKLRAKDLLEAQEDYVETFDRNRSLSLHLFEHVHGESRDRGQAMVDLSELYKEEGLTLGKNELPDYLPAFLEYLSYLPKDESVEMLKEPMTIIKALSKRLNERDSEYGIIFDSILKIAGREPEMVQQKKIFKISNEQLDKEWEEKPVSFLGAEAPQSKGGCGGLGCHCGSSKLSAI